MTPRVALLGSTGMLGRAIAAALAERGAEVLVVSRRALDLAAPGDLSTALPSGLSTVINCAAYTDVDRAEQTPDQADRVNGHGVAALAERCRAIDATLVTFGTDYVFDGRATEPYAVDRPVDPVNAYGRSKALGERLLAESGARHLLVRTSWLYAPWGNNFVRTMAKLTQERDSLRVVNDQRGRPTSSRHLARATLDLVERGAEGIFHVTDGGECSWYELALHVRDHLGHTCEVAPCTTAEFPRPAPRPAYSVLDLTKTEALLGPMPDYRPLVSAALDDAQLAGSTS